MVPKPGTEIRKTEVDIGVADFWVIYDRHIVVDHTVSFHSEPDLILTASPTEDHKFSACIRPFSTKAMD